MDAGLLRDQRARCFCWGGSRLMNGLKNTLPGAGTDVRLVVDDPRDGRFGNTRESGNMFETVIHLHYHTFGNVSQFISSVLKIAKRVNLFVTFSRFYPLQLN